MPGTEHYRKMAEEVEQTAREMSEPMRSELLGLAERWRRLADVAKAREEGNDGIEEDDDEPGK